MRGIRLWFGAAFVALATGSGCCSWWCNHCDRCRGHVAPAPVAVSAPSACVPCVPPPVCCQPVCCPPGTVPAVAPIVPQGWR